GGGELGRAGVDALVRRPDLQLVTLVADRLLRHVEEARQAGIREPLALERAQPLGAERTESFLAHLLFLPHELFDLREEPGIDVGQLGYPAEAPAGAKRVRHVQRSVAPRRAELGVGA